MKYTEHVQDIAKFEEEGRPRMLYYVLYTDTETQKFLVKYDLAANVLLKYNFKVGIVNCSNIQAEKCQDNKVDYNVYIYNENDVKRIPTSAVSNMNSLVSAGLKMLLKQKLHKIRTKDERINIIVRCQDLKNVVLGYFLYPDSIEQRTFLEAAYQNNGTEEFILTNSIQVVSDLKESSTQNKRRLVWLLHCKSYNLWSGLKIKGVCYDEIFQQNIEVPSILKAIQKMDIDDNAIETKLAEQKDSSERVISSHFDRKYSVDHDEVTEVVFGSKYYLSKPFKITSLTEETLPDIENSSTHSLEDVIQATKEDINNILDGSFQSAINLTSICILGLFPEQSTEIKKFYKVAKAEKGTALFILLTGSDAAYFGHLQQVAVPSVLTLKWTNQDLSINKMVDQFSVPAMTTFVKNSYKSHFMELFPDILPKILQSGQPLVILFIKSMEEESYSNIQQLSMSKLGQDMVFTWINVTALNNFGTELLETYFENPSTPALSVVYFSEI
ncbi:Hypothetical predicted protein [Octopus vulgaris]|uniref:TXNDC16 N-terminal domain-containing protein n=1 Tax=Octopus vulgaris TaxID=6645 RepID=A0AA36AHC6_OCTVU|nr:Hypothetical predicted protein [Octopus vulgaris]